MSVDNYHTRFHQNPTLNPVLLSLVSSIAAVYVQIRYTDKTTACNNKENDSPFVMIACDPDVVVTGVVVVVGKVGVLVTANVVMVVVVAAVGVTSGASVTAVTFSKILGTLQKLASQIPYLQELEIMKTI